MPNGKACNKRPEKWKEKGKLAKGFYHSVL
jgi:hypothetical protein